MGRKNYTDLHDLISDLDNESLVEDADRDLLEDDDLALLHGPTRYKPAPVKKPKPPRKAKAPAKKKKKPRKKHA